MPLKMRRGKQQVLLNYLPGRTFDFEKVGVIARVDQIRGTPHQDLSEQLVLNAVAEYAASWSETHRPVLRDEVLKSTRRFVFLDPREVKATMFPSVFWCQRSGCGRVLSSPNGEIPASECPTCRKGKLVQLRFVRVHRCGALQPLNPYFCKNCQTSNYMSLNTHGSERIGSFRWQCTKCRRTYSVFGGRCRECQWSTAIPGVNQPENASIEVHRAGRTFYPHFVVLLNQPGKDLSLFLSTPYWQQLAGAAFLELPELAGKRLTDLRSDPGEQDHASQFDMATLKGQGFTDEQVRQFLEMQAQLMDSKRRDKEASSPARITRALVERTGVPEPVWQRSGKEMLEAVLPIQSSNTQEIPAMESDSNGGETIAADSARSMGFERITLIADFPITRATFGFSRVDYQPQKCQLNPFSPDRDHEGRYPVFVDIVQADALSIRLNPVNVWRWLELNGLSPNFPESASDQDLAKRAYFIGLLDETLLGETLRADRAEERMVFGLLHTLSHLAIRQAALLCGLDSTSLSEYILPKALTFSLYCNHRFGATIGALASLFEQSLGEWLQAIREADRCVYDPVCGDRGGSCHACTHLSETSCRFFNLNLGRSLLFGGHDPELGKINYGYFDIK